MLNIPARITQGVTVEASGRLDDYKASEYSLQVVFVRDGQQTTVGATADGDDFVLTIPKATTAEMGVGVHAWQAFVEDAGGTVRYKVGSGETTVEQDFGAMSGGHDPRTELRRQVEAMRAVIAGAATDDQRRVKYADREIERYDRAELITIYRFLRAELQAEERAARVAQGKTFGGRVRVRFK